MSASGGAPIVPLLGQSFATMHGGCGQQGVGTAPVGSAGGRFRRIPPRGGHYTSHGRAHGNSPPPSDGCVTAFMAGIHVTSSPWQGQLSSIPVPAMPTEDASIITSIDPHVTISSDSTVSSSLPTFPMPQLGSSVEMLLEPPPPANCCSPPDTHPTESSTHISVAPTQGLLDFLSSTYVSSLFQGIFSSSFC